LAVGNKEESVQGDQQEYGEPSRRNGAISYMPCEKECNGGNWFI